MSQTKTEIKPPVSVIESLTGGFETAVAQWPALFFPLALDVFLWLGPRLTMQPLAQRLIAFLKNAPMPDPTSVENQKMMIEMWQTIGERTNLFAILSTWPLGLPSLMTTVLPVRMPLGTPPLWPLNSIPLLVAIFIFFNLGGLFLGVLYYSVLANQLREQPFGFSQFWRGSLRTGVKILAFVFLLLALGFIMGLPFFIVVTLVQFLSPTLASLLIALAGAVALWAWVYVGFTIPSMVLQDRSLWGALWDSVRVVQFNIPAVMGLYLLTLILNWGLGYLWSQPAPESWLMLAAVGGHAFVATALAAAPYVFYKDRYRYWVEVKNQKSGVGSQ